MLQGEDMMAMAQDFFKTHPFAQVVKDLAIDRKIFEIAWREFEGMCRDHMQRYNTDEYTAFQAIANRLPAEHMKAMSTFGSAYARIVESVASRITEEQWRDLKSEDPTTFNYLQYLIFGHKVDDPTYVPLFPFKPSAEFKIDWSKFRLQGLGCMDDLGFPIVFVGVAVLIAIGIIAAAVVIHKGFSASEASEKAFTEQYKLCQESSQIIAQLRANQAKMTLEHYKALLDADIKSTMERKDLTEAQKQEERQRLTSEFVKRAEALNAETQKALEMPPSPREARPPSRTSETAKEVGKALGTLAWIVGIAAAAYLAAVIIQKVPSPSTRPAGQYA